MPKRFHPTLNASQTLLTIQEASNFLHCHPNTLRKWDKKGILHAIHVGKRGDRRYKKEDLLLLLNDGQPISSQRQTDEVLEQMAESYIAWDRNWRYKAINTNAAKFLHKKRDELLGKNMLDIFPKLQKTELFHVMQETLKNGIARKYIYFSPIRHLWIDAYLYPSESGLSMYFEDIDEEKHHEIVNNFLLKASTVLSSSLDYNRTISNLGEFIVPTIADWFALEILNEKGISQTLSIMHKDPGKIALAKSLRALFLKYPEARQMQNQTIKTGKPTYFFQVSKKDMEKGAINSEHLYLMQQLNFHSVIVVPLLAEGKVIGVADFMLSETERSYDELDVKVATEIGRLAGMAIAHARLYTNLEEELKQRKKVEQSLRQSERKLDAFLSHSNDAFLVLDKDGTVKYRTPFAQKLSGYDNTEVEKVGLFHHFHEDDRDRIKKELQNIAQMPGKTITTEYRIRHKNGKILWFESTATNWLNEPSVNGIIVNFRDVTRRKTIENRLKLQAQMIESANDAVFVTDKNNKILYWNDQAKKLYGYTQKEAVGKKTYTLLKTKFPIPYEDLLIILQQKGVWEGELTHTLKNKRSIVVDSRWSCVKRDHSFSIIEINRDITEKKEMEYRKDEFISIASHELKTPLTSLKVYTQYLQKYTPVLHDQTLKKYLNRISEQTDNLTGLVSDLLDISKIQKGMLPFSRKVFSFNKCIQELVEVANATQIHKITLNGNLPLVCGDEERLCQVIDNLLSNAVKYSPDKNPIEITLSSNKAYAKICVRDYGIGIEKKYQMKIFERFFRAGDASEHTYPGLGIGLYICSQIVNRHGGEIWVDSEKGKGSTFCFTIPVAKQ